MWVFHIHFDIFFSVFLAHVLQQTSEINYVDIDSKWVYIRAYNLLKFFNTYEHFTYIWNAPLISCSSCLLMRKVDVCVLVMHHDHVCFNAHKLFAKLTSTTHELSMPVRFLKCITYTLVLFFYALVI